MGQGKLAPGAPEEEVDTGPHAPGGRPLKDARSGKREKLVLLSLALGTALEWYDFSIVAQLDGPLMANFFPAHASAEVKTLAFWLVYAAAFVVRPLGACVFGSIGDVFGRKVSLLSTILLMGCATTLVGCLPSYNQIGATAPALLAVLRILMGFALGAEYTTAIVYVHEAARGHNKALHAGAIASCSAAGALVGLSVILIVQAATSSDKMMAWGWRVPFFVAFPIVGTALLLRMHMDETKDFLAARGCERSDTAGWSSRGNSRAPSATGTGALAVDAAGSPSAAGPAFLPCAPRCAPRDMPVVRLLRGCSLGLALDVAYVAWLASAIYVVYGWLPARIRSQGIMPPLMSFGMVFTSLVTEFAAVLAGAWVALHVPVVAACAAAAPLISTFFVAAIAVVDTGSVAGVWLVQNVGLGLCGLVLGIHAAAFVYIYPTAVRSTGFSLAYNVGCAVGGAAPAVVSALSIAAQRSSVDFSRFVPAIWLLVLSVPAACAALWLMRVAPLVNSCGHSEAHGDQDEEPSDGAALMALA